MEKSIFSSEYEILCAEIVAVRIKAGLTQRQLAKRLRVPHSWVAKVECGDRRVDFVELYWVLSACGVEPGRTLTRIVKAISKMKKRRRADV